MLLLPHEIESRTQAGGKGFRLKQLHDLDFKVPGFVVLPSDFLQKEISPDSDKSSSIRSYEFPPGWKNKLENGIPDARQKWFAVRSSGVNEDGKQFLFAGQFKTRLYVSFDQLEEAVKDVLLSVYSDIITAYTKQHGVSEPMSMAVVIQEMVDADVSGVAFAINPVNGNPDEKSKLCRIGKNKYAALVLNYMHNFLYLGI